MIATDDNGKATAISFNHIFGGDATQSLIYESCVDPLVKAIFEGFNTTVLGYGQTVNKKSYTSPIHWVLLIM